MTQHWAVFNSFEFQMSDEAVADCQHQGQCDADVAYWVEKIDLSRISPKAIADELREYGAWDDEELADELENKKRIIWIAAGNIQGQQAEAT